MLNSDCGDSPAEHCGSAGGPPWPLEVDAEPEVVLDLDEQVGEPDRATAGVQPAVQFDEAVRLRRVEVLDSGGDMPSPCSSRRVRLAAGAGVRAGKVVRFPADRLWSEYGLTHLAPRTASFPWATA